MRLNKKTLKLISLLLFCALLCGCGAKQPAPEPTPKPTATPEPLKAQAGPIDACVFFDSYVRLFPDPQGLGKTIFTFSIDTPVIFIEGSEAASEKINAFMKAMDEQIVPGENGSSTQMDAMTYYLSLAEDCYTAYAGTDKEDECSFSYVRTARVLRCDSLVTEFEYSLYVSSAEGATQERSVYAFDSATGEPLPAESVTEENYPSYEAPGEGYVGVFQMENYLTDGIGVEDMIEADENGQDYLIQAIGTVDALEINEIFYNADCTAYTTGRCLYYRTRLTDEGVQLRYEIPAGTPDLELRFNMHGRSVGNVLTRDAQTGAIALKNTENPDYSG